MKVAINCDFDISKLNLSREEEAIMNKCIVMSTQVWTGLVDGEIACVWGVAPPTFLSTQAYLWLYTTELVKEHQFIFVRHSQKIIEKLLKEYELIVGICAVEAENSQRWLRWLGAVFEGSDGKHVMFKIRKK